MSAGISCHPVEDGAVKLQTSHTNRCKSARMSNVLNICVSGGRPEVHLKFLCSSNIIHLGRDVSHYNVIVVNVAGG